MTRIIVPEDIEKRSFEIIEDETKRLKGKIPFREEEWKIVRRLIHTSADFDVLDNIRFHPMAVETGIDAIKRGCYIVTDTNMAMAGISRSKLNGFEVKLKCFVGDKDVAEEAKKRGCTRSMVAVEKAMSLGENVIFGIGNSPTALFHLIELMEKDNFRPVLVLGMVVGFVGAKESKEELIARSKVPYIALRGRKGGSPMISATINGLLELC